MNLTTKYVLKLTDPQFSGYIYCIKDCIPPFGSSEFFSPDSVFDTEQEARDHLKVMLESGWYRPDITEANFEVVKVKRYLGMNFGLFYYTEKGYEEFKEYKNED